MSETTIEWTVTIAPDGRVFPGFTFNAWRGCQKISPGCANCYAEALDNWLHGGKHWGPNGVRGTHSDAYWRKPLAWDRKAARLGVRLKVFVNSMADVFEDRPELAAPRARLFRLIDMTPHLDWLLLTKRPENAARLWRKAQERARGLLDGEMIEEFAGPTWAGNIWLGTTVEDQRRADARIPHLLAVPAAVRFLSCEPLLGLVDLSAFFGGPYITLPGDRVEANYNAGIDWVIAGGESGHGARPMHPRWARSLRDQCAAASVPFLFKQWGEWAPDCLCGGEKACREMPRPTPGPVGVMFRCGKSAAGRHLDGRTHDEFPEARREARVERSGAILEGRR